MTRIVPLSQVNGLAQGGAISIGNFDGVHCGHAELLASVRRLADRFGGPAIVVTLDPHPASILRPEAAPQRLTTIRRRAELMQPLGIDYLVTCPVDQDFLDLSAQEFFDTLVVKQLATRGMVEGPNFFFGKGRGGDIEVLTGLCETNHVELEIVAATQDQKQMISSTRIRELLIDGDVAQANGLLTAAYQICGSVVKGAQRGRTIGFPTANLIDTDVMLPRDGVYGGRAFVMNDQGGHDAGFKAAINIGPNPTFTDDAVQKVEVHLLNFDGDLYGKQLKVEIHGRVRDITKFDSPDDLVGQLRRDILSIQASTFERNEN